jgi:hypothetical protein
MLHLSPLKIQSASPILGLMALLVLQQQSSNNTTNLLLNFFFHHQYSNNIEKERSGSLDGE